MNPELLDKLSELKVELEIWETTLASFRSSADMQYDKACLDNLLNRIQQTKKLRKNVEKQLSRTKERVVQYFVDEFNFYEQEEMELHEMFCVLTMMKDLEKSVRRRLSTPDYFPPSHAHATPFWSCSKLPEFAITST